MSEIFGVPMSQGLPLPGTMFFPEKMFYRYRERPVLRRYSSLIVLPCSLKQIPFTVPSHVPASGYRRTESSTRSLDEGLVGGSEPTTPTGKRPSVEIPGELIYHCCCCWWWWWWCWWWWWWWWWWW